MNCIQKEIDIDDSDEFETISWISNENKSESIYCCNCADSDFSDYSDNCNCECHFMDYNSDEESNENENKRNKKRIIQ
jgi:hypothetical protein